MLAGFSDFLQNQQHGISLLKNKSRSLQLGSVGPGEIVGLDAFMNSEGRALFSASVISERFSYFVVPQHSAAVMFEPRSMRHATEYFTQIVTARLDYYLRKISILSSTDRESKPAEELEADHNDYLRMLKQSGGNRNLFKRPQRSSEKMSFPSEKRIARELAVWYKSVFGEQSRLKSPSRQNFELDIKKDNTGFLQKKLSRERRVEQARQRERERRRVMKDQGASAQEKDACRVDPVFRSTFEDLYSSIDRVSPKKTSALSSAGSGIKSVRRFDFNSPHKAQPLASSFAQSEAKPGPPAPQPADLQKILRIFKAKEPQHRKSSSSKTLLTAFAHGSELQTGSSRASKEPAEPALSSRVTLGSKPTHVRIVSAQLERQQLKKQESSGSFRLLFDASLQECKVIKNTGEASRQATNLKTDSLDRIRAKIMLKAKYRLRSSKSPREPPAVLFGPVTPLSGGPEPGLASLSATKATGSELSGLQSSAKELIQRGRANRQ